MDDDTLHHRPTPKRPQTGWLAWQSTVGYMAQELSPEIALTITVYPVNANTFGWSAALYWGENNEAIHAEDTLADALRGLWFKVEAHHRIFNTLEDAARRPVNYAEGDWLDDATQSALDRLLQVTAATFSSGWRVIITYQPVDNPDMRVQAGLYKDDGTIQVEGQGPSLRDACQMLYRSAARYYTR